MQTTVEAMVKALTDERENQMQVAHEMHMQELHEEESQALLMVDKINETVDNLREIATEVYWMEGAKPELRGQDGWLDQSFAGVEHDWLKDGEFIGSFNSGGWCMIDVWRAADGTMLTVTDEVIVRYPAMPPEGIFDAVYEDEGLDGKNLGVVYLV